MTPINRSPANSRDILKNLIELYKEHKDIEYLHEAQTLSVQFGEDDLFEEVTFLIFTEGLIDTYKPTGGNYEHT